LYLEFPPKEESQKVAAMIEEMETKVETLKKKREEKEAKMRSSGNYEKSKMKNKLN
jgi:restriction endonuclease S subunit